MAAADENEASDGDRPLMLVDPERPPWWRRPIPFLLVATAVIANAVIALAGTRPGTGAGGVWFAVVPLLLTAWTAELWATVLRLRRAVVAAVVPVVVIGAVWYVAFRFLDPAEPGASSAGLALALLLGFLVPPVHAFIAYSASCLEGRVAEAVAATIALVLFVALHFLPLPLDEIGHDVAGPRVDGFIDDVYDGTIVPSERYWLGPYSYDRICPASPDTVIVWNSEPSGWRGEVTVAALHRGGMIDEYMIGGSENGDWRIDCAYEWRVDDW